MLIVLHIRRVWSTILSSCLTFVQNVLPEFSENGSTPLCFGTDNTARSPPYKKWQTMGNSIKKRGLFIFIFILSYAFTTNAQEVSYEGETNGVLMLSVSEYNIKKQDAIDQAIKDAYFQILFRGIPGSTANKNALLGTDESVVNTHHQYYDNMITGARLYSFINYSSLSYYKRKEAVVKLSINVKALVEDLERNNLYRRFGLY